MEIILKQYVQNLGEKNDIVEVKDGYARNYLIPQGMAVLATSSAKKMHAENERQAQHKKEHMLKEAQQLAEKIGEMKLQIEMLAGESGKIFGSVTTNLVSNKLSEAGIEVDRKRVSFVDEVKELGEHEVTIDLHKEVKATLTINVVAAEKE